MENNKLVAHTKGSIGLDLHAKTDDILLPKETKIIKSNLDGPLAADFSIAGIIAPRSSMSKREILTHTGIIDADYLGNVGIILTNLTEQPIEIKKNERIAQILLFKKETFIIPNFIDKDRTGGFGSTNN